MTLSSIQLEAFAEVARTGSFSKAAKNLHITQSALSQRVINLEHELSTSLIVRDSAGLRLTPAGEELLRYCQTKESLEVEVLSRLASKDARLAGAIRIGAFSSVARSVIMPSLSKLMLANELRIELCSRELNELASMLARNEVDFIVTMHETDKQGVESHLLGYEENVLVEKAGQATVPDLFFDHDPDDQTTFTFFKKQKGRVPKSFRRAYLDEVYALIDGVALGWGRAVVPSHLVAGNPALRVVERCAPLKIPVFLQYYRQPFYARLHQDIVKELRAHVPRHLAKR